MLFEVYCSHLVRRKYTVNVLMMEEEAKGRASSAHPGTSLASPTLQDSHYCWGAVCDR